MVEKLYVGDQHAVGSRQAKVRKYWDPIKATRSGGSEGENICDCIGNIGT